MEEEPIIIEINRWGEPDNLIRLELPPVYLNETEVETEG